ncbi:MAG: AbrB family transcriptional regulator [Candidatus Anoxymicrobium japonicum]|uniref:AbrB family transcriptional regulator n=1 Tax=Candidatus Anoxymicrobium japonicum TaxID=2013648 RepID=A0A2N3G6J3_9ACTN|nr:MAG: AbrB family transcriptional regulator [Candidatus Anoxymicrobium japonicum]
MPKITDRSVLTKKSQVTIPKKVREAIGVKPGDEVRFKVKGKTAVVEPVVSNLNKHFGSVKPKKKPEDFKKAREAFEKGVARNVAGDR